MIKLQLDDDYETKGTAKKSFSTNAIQLTIICIGAAVCGIMAGVAIIATLVLIVKYLLGGG